MNLTILKHLVAGLFLVLMCFASFAMAAALDVGGLAGEVDWLAYLDREDPNDPNYVMVYSDGCQSGGQLGAGGTLAGVADGDNGSGSWSQPAYRYDQYRDLLSEARRHFGDIGSGGSDWPDSPASGPLWSEQPNIGAPEGYGEPAACFREGEVETDWDPLQEPVVEDSIGVPIIPEPITISMLALGGGYILSRRRGGK